MSTVNYGNEIAAARTAEDAQRLESANRKVFEEILARFPISDCEANYQLLRSFVNPMTVQGCEYLVKGNVKDFTLAWTSREQLIEDLVKQRRAGASQKTLSNADLQSWKIRVSVWSLRQLRDYKNKLTFLKEHPTAESAKEFLAGVRKVEPNPFPGFPRLPERMVLPYGPIVYTDINAAYLQDLVRSDFYAFKRLCTLYGSTQIDARMKGIA